MKSLLIALFIVATVGCGGTKERYVRLAEEVQPKSAMVRVDGIAEVMVMSLSMDKKGNMLFNIETATKPVTYLGSAVFITPYGTLLSCAHVFDMVEVTTITITMSNGKTRLATLLNKDVPRDLALLKTKGYSDYAPLSTNRLRVGQEVLAVGNPHGLEFSTSHGIISALDRDIDTGFYFTQVDAPINSGNSGGPLFNLNGDLIGINARKGAGADGLGFAIAPDVINDFLSQFRGI